MRKRGAGSVTRRALFRAHSWIGVFAGLLLFVICWSGTFAVVSNEIDWVLNPDIRAGSGGDKASWSEIERAVKSAFPDGEISGFEAPRTAGFAAQVGVDLPDQQYLRVYVDPHTGEVNGATSYFNVQRFFRSFHMNLFAGAVGGYVVFILSLFLLASVALPFFFYKRWWRGFLKLETNRGARVFWSDVHKLGGLWSLWFALIIALTGVWYLVEALRGDIGDGKLAWTGTGAFAVNILPPLESSDRLAEMPLDDLVARARAVRPDLQIRSMWREAGYFYVDGQAGHLLARDRANKLYLDPHTGKVAYDQRADDQPAWWRLSDTADPLHFGDFAGLASKLVWFAFGLVVSALALTGAWLHAQRLARDAGRRVAWPGAGLAMAATAVMLAASAWGGVVELLSYGPLVGGARRIPDMPIGVALFIAAWIAATIAIMCAWMRALAKREAARRPAPHGRSAFARIGSAPTAFGMSAFDRADDRKPSPMDADRSAG